jgi:CheY-like chemotaxis protein
LQILLVEDDFAVRELTAELLIHFGHRVVETESATRALQLLQSGSIQPDLVLTDIRMPGLPVPGFVEAVKRLEPAPKILLITGWLDPGLGVPCISKPFTGETLKFAVINAFMGNPL